jgi:hypothetical protein
MIADDCLDSRLERLAASLVPVPVPVLAHEVQSEDGNGNQEQEHFERAGSAIWRHTKQSFDEVHCASNHESSGI